MPSAPTRRRPETIWARLEARTSRSTTRNVAVVVSTSSRSTSVPVARTPVTDTSIYDRETDRSPSAARTVNGASAERVSES